MKDNKEFKPYIPAEKITPEFTVTSIIMGIILAIVFGAANAYLGLRVGMTVSASIPAAVGTTIGQLYAEGGASAIWGSYVRYIGAGAIATGGIISLIKSLPPCHPEWWA